MWSVPGVCVEKRAPLDFFQSRALPRTATPLHFLRARARADGLARPSAHARATHKHTFHSLSLTGGRANLRSGRRSGAGAPHSARRASRETHTHTHAGALFVQGVGLSLSHAHAPQKKNHKHARTHTLTPARTHTHTHTPRESPHKHAHTQPQKNTHDQPLNSTPPTQPTSP